MRKIVLVFFGANIILVSFQSKEEFSKERKVLLFSNKM